MKDYIKEFKKQKNRKNSLIVLSSLVFAFSLNAFMFYTPVGNKLQTSVKNYSNPKTDKVVTSDLYFKKSGTGSDIIELFSGNKMEKVTEIRFSVISDPAGLKINDIFTDDKNIDVIKSSNVPGISMVVLRLKKPVDISKGQSLLKVVYTKTTGGETSLNLAETQFVSNKETFELQSSGVEF